MAEQTNGPLEIETDQEATDILATNFSSTELRDLASNAGVSRERGDNMRATAQKIVAQDPALAVALIEADRLVNMDASAFREAREVDEEYISLAEAMERSRNRKMFYKLRELKNITDTLPHYDVEVNWEYGAEVSDGGYEPGLTSVIIKPSEDVEMNPLLESRAHVLLTPHGRCTMLTADSNDYITRSTPDPSHQWRVAMEKLGRFWNPSE